MAGLLNAYGYDARAVANELLAIAKRRGIRVTIMQLVKLIYFAQGWSLAYREKGITRDQAQAWQYGPVYPTVYKAFSKIGSRPIGGPILQSNGQPFDAPFTDEEREMLDWVVEKYGNMHAFTLSQMTHEPGSPWKTVADRSGFYKDIPDILIKDHFKSYIEENAA